VNPKQLDNLEASLVMMGFKLHVTHPGWYNQELLVYINKEDALYIEIYMHANFLKIKPVLSMTPRDENTMSTPLGKNTIKDIAKYMHKYRDDHNDDRTVQGYANFNGILHKA